MVLVSLPYPGCYFLAFHCSAKKGFLRHCMDHVHQLNPDEHKYGALLAKRLCAPSSLPLWKKKMAGKRKKKDNSGMDLLVESAVAEETVKLKKKKRRKKGAHKDKSGRECD
jgi:hypothetical protein